MRTAISVFLILFSLNCLLIAEEISLPITKVVLYKHGVVYVERKGDISESQTVSLSLKESQMSDVLKSLIAIDIDGEILEAEYSSRKPIAEMLEDFSVNLGVNSNVVSLLHQIPGAPIQIQTGPDNIKGALIGIRKRKTYHDKFLAEQLVLDILDETGNFRSFLLDDIKNLRITDPQLRNEVSECLNRIYEYGKKDVNNLRIFTKGNKSRQILIGYVVESPVWKTSYRIVFSDNKKPFFEGWAIADNLSGEDWKNISLSFVSGMPVSFVYDLYTPVYRERPSIKVEQELSAVPMQAEEAFLFDMGEAPAMGMVSETRKTKPRAMPKSAFFSKGLDQSKKIKTIAQASGELFEYKVGSSVSIMNNHSALLPITAGEIDGKPVSFYNEENRHNNPFSCMWLKNTTGLTLEGGAATIYENDTYAGEAVLKTLKPGEKTFVSYAVDLGVLVETSRGSKRKDTHMIKIVNGLFRAYYKK
ncbi:MAG: hypothetical protein P9M03_13000, partial [Candidatus Theseobacter exili]|nr:hypothetical protein [Candidatus Theseobacter exili]